MTDATRIATLEAQLEVVAADRDQAREMLRDLGRENAKLRAALNLHREALADHRRELKRLARVEAAARAIWDRWCSDYGLGRGDEKIIEALGAALSEEEGTPAMPPPDNGAAAFERRMRALSPSPATPSEGRCLYGATVCTHAQCLGSGRATPRGDRL